MTTVLDIPEGKDVAVIGTLYKDMKLKPSILDEYTKVTCLHLPLRGSLRLSPHPRVRILQTHKLCMSCCASAHTLCMISVVVVVTEVELDVFVGLRIDLL